MKRGALLIAFGLPFTVLLFNGCNLGPDYHPPEVSTPSSWKESESHSSQSLASWCEIFNDAELNRLEESAIAGNYDLKIAAAKVDEARSSARIDAAELYPSLSADPSYARSKLSPNRSNPIPFPMQSFTGDNFKFPLDLSYEIDIWGRVRKSFEAGSHEAEAAQAAYYTVLLTLTGDVAQNYFQLRALDSELIVLEKHIQLERDAVQIAEERYRAGLTNEYDLNRAKLELATTQAEVPEVQRKRAGFEHALAILCAETPTSFSLATNPLSELPPSVPPGLPSELLKRRPDVIEAERRIAAENARLGVARAAFFPSIKLTGTAGFESADLSDLFTWESRIWSLGPSVSIPIFQGGRHDANLKAEKARYEQALSEYQKRVLVAFKDVEDALSNLRFKAAQAEKQSEAILAARESWVVAQLRYDRGLANYLEVVDAERAVLQAEQTGTHVLGDRLSNTVLLIKALGGGWSELANKSTAPSQATQ